MLKAIRSVPPKVLVASGVLFGLWLVLLSLVPPVALFIACAGLFAWAAFTVINYLTGI